MARAAAKQRYLQPPQTSSCASEESQAKPKMIAGTAAFAIFAHRGDDALACLSGLNEGFKGMTVPQIHTGNSILTSVRLRLRLRQIELDVELAQLFRSHRRRRAHEQILGALIHRKEHDFA